MAHSILRTPLLTHESLPPTLLISIHATVEAIKECENFLTSLKRKSLIEFKLKLEKHLERQLHATAQQQQVDQSFYSPNQASCCTRATSNANVNTILKRIAKQENYNLTYYQESSIINNNNTNYSTPLSRLSATLLCEICKKNKKKEEESQPLTAIHRL